MYTPVNQHRLSLKARQEFERVKRFLETMASRVEVDKNLYDEFIEAMPVSDREHYKREFPIGNKIVIRG
jgi:nitrate reductase assembly molybdenum cofactor insertion protein NarJ